jgi:hypothetical protein
MYGSRNFGDRFGGKEGALRAMRTYTVQASSQELEDKIFVLNGLGL